MSTANGAQVVATTPDDTGPLPPDPAEGNTGLNPLAGARFLPKVGSPALSKHAFNNLMTNVRAQDGPFREGVVPLGLSYPLSLEEADWLNTHFGFAP